MSRRVRAFGGSLVLLGVLPILGGCESIRQAMGLRSSSVESAGPIDPEKPLDVDTPLDVKSSRPAPFFKNSRLSGGLSDQAREIERDLGIR